VKMGMRPFSLAGVQTVVQT